MSPRVVALAAGIVAVVGWAVTTLAQQQVSAAPNEIVIDDFRFAPATMTVAPGTRVTWINHDGEPHTIVSVDKDAVPFKSSALDTDDKFSFVFDKPGNYKYFCSVHPRMVGTVVVK